MKVLDSTQIEKKKMAIAGNLKWDFEIIPCNGSVGSRLKVPQS